MKNAWHEAKSHGRVKPATLLGDADPNQVYDTCRGCGRCMHLNKAGYCATEECSARMLARAQQAGTIVKIGSLTVYNRDTVAHMRPPPVPEHTQQTLRNRGLLVDPLPVCSYTDCTQIPRPDDDLCIQHRLEENARLAKEEPKNFHSTVSDGAEDRVRGRKRRHRQRDVDTHNRIRGLDKIKLK